MGGVPEGSIIRTTNTQVTHFYHWKSAQLTQVARTWSEYLTSTEICTSSQVESIPESTATKSLTRRQLIHA